MAQATERNEQQPDVLRVFQSKQETKAFYDKISRVYDLLADKVKIQFGNQLLHC
ncbi:MAG: hypothetical protein U0Y68_13910 [Blastocatellia bacterium]